MGISSEFFENLFTPDKIYITVAVIATLAFFFVSVLAGVTIRQRQRQVMSNTKYRPRKRLMDNTEKKCFQLLIELFGNKFYVIPQVELLALLNYRVGTQDYRQARGFIENKTVDFVLCNKRDVRPICAVKLYDPKAGQELGSDPEDMERFFRSARLPFVYLPRKQSITRKNIIDEFSRVIYEISKS